MTKKRFSVCYVIKPNGDITCMFNCTGDRSDWFGGLAPVKALGLRVNWFEKLFAYEERECARHGGEMDRIYYGGTQQWDN